MTAQQIRVLSLHLAGLRAKEIGKTLGISDQTVKVHLQAVYKKAGSNRIPDLATFAVKERAITARHPLVLAVADVRGC